MSDVVLVEHRVAVKTNPIASSHRNPQRGETEYGKKCCAQEEVGIGFGHEGLCLEVRLTQV